MDLAIVIPTYGTQNALNRILDEIPAAYRAGVIVVDDGSEIPITAPGVQLVRHENNRGYGAAQKSGFDLALAAGAERVVLLHGDGQYPTADVLALDAVLETHEAVIGSRFMDMVDNEVPAWRRFGVRVLTGLANHRFGTRISELHSGARAYRAQTLRGLDYGRFSDDYIFDHQMLAAILAGGKSLGEQKVRCHYGEGSLSISPWRAVIYSVGVVGTLLRPPR